MSATTYAEIPAGDLKKGDIFDLVNEVVSVRRNSRTGTPMIDVKCKVIDRRTGVAVMGITRHFFEWETVQLEVVST